MEKTYKSSTKRIKIGTILDADVVQQLKQRALREKKTISDVVHEAVISYNRSETTRADQRKEAARRLTTNPFNVSTEQIIADLEEDYYEQ